MLPASPAGPSILFRVIRSGGWSSTGYPSPRRTSWGSRTRASRWPCGCWICSARASAMAKLLASETAQFVAHGAVQILGAAALERGHVLERLYREVRGPRIYEGTSEIQREVIARELFR